MNSYKRLVRGASALGSDLGSRLHHVWREIRVVDGAANPYLAFAGIIAAGLDGIARKLDQGPINHDNLTRRPKKTWRRVTSVIHMVGGACNRNPNLMRNLRADLVKFER